MLFRSEVAANAERISNSILSSGDVFVKQSQALTALADDTAGKVNQSVINLVDAGKAFELQGQNIVKETDRQGTRKSLLQHHSSKASILRRSAFFIVQLSHPYMTTGKTIALTRWTFVGKSNVSAFEYAI